MMRFFRIGIWLVAGMMGLILQPVMAADHDVADSFYDNTDNDAIGYLQCVPFARETSGIQIYGDAYSWWSQADGKYARGNLPQRRAVMAFRPHGAMRLGHVATVTKIIDSRTVLLSHANWSTINGRRGQIERNVKAIDVSKNNDWSEVRVWYAPIQALGTTVYPLYGFIYSGKPPKAVKDKDWERNERERRDHPQFADAGPHKPSRAFLSAMTTAASAQTEPLASEESTIDPIGALLVKLGN